MRDLVIKYGQKNDKTVATIYCCKVLLSIFMSFCFLFCNGQAKLLDPNGEGHGHYEPDGSASCKYLKKRFSYLCGGTAADMLTFKKVTKAEADVVLANTSNYYRKTCLSVSYKGSWMNTPTSDKIDATYPTIVYAYSIPYTGTVNLVDGTVYSKQCYEVYWFTEDGSDPIITGVANNLFQNGGKGSLLEDVSGISTWDFSGVTSMERMFSSCKKLNNVSFGTTVNMSSLKSFKQMFYQCFSMSTQNLATFFNTLMFDKSKLNSTQPDVVHDLVAFKNLHFTTANNIEYVVNPSSYSFDYVNGPITNMQIRNLGGERFGNAVNFHWDLMYETNVSKFTIQRSADGGTTWNDVKECNGLGDTSVVTSIYRETWEIPNEDVLDDLYRVKYTKTDHTESYSDNFTVENYQCFNLLNTTTGHTTPICPVDGNVTINLNDLVEDGTYVIQEGQTIKCNNFVVCCRDQYSATVNGLNKKLQCDGTIICANEFKIDQLGYKNQNNPYFTTGCSANILANSIIIGYVYDIQPFYGTWVSKTFNIKNGNGQDIEFPTCSYVNSTEILINANVSNGIMLNGHLISERISSTKDIYLNYDGTSESKAIITIGSLEGYNSWNNVKIISNEHSILNMCSNPRKNTADNIGFFLGLVLYVSDAATGWVGDKNPETERDINDNVTKSNPYWDIRNAHGNTDIHAAQLIGGYDSFDDCIAEKNMYALLPITLKSFSFKQDIFYWETASETDNDYFVVEYSKNGKDWVECTERVASMSNTGYSYSTEPIIPINQSLFSYFRLKQVDLNGEYSYSNVVTVSFTVENPCSEEYESSKMKIREFGNRFYRLINGELIYCENDNE
ncbi:MAG: DUF285 domain-containing protein [Bacteroidales bacterium]|nr:DUF285 domain-containing protein [Bacteroidales bacterium]